MEHAPGGTVRMEMPGTTSAMTRLDPVPGEDGLAGISDEKQLLCHSVGLSNGRDLILKQRLFGSTDSESNHWDDVKEYYFYLNRTQTNEYRGKDGRRKPKILERADPRENQRTKTVQSCRFDNGIRKNDRGYSPCASATGLRSDVPGTSADNHSSPLVYWKACLGSLRANATNTL